MEGDIVTLIRGSINEVLSDTFPVDAIFTHFRQLFFNELSKEPEVRSVTVYLNEEDQTFDFLVEIEELPWEKIYSIIENAISRSIESTRLRFISSKDLYDIEQEPEISNLSFSWI